MRAIILAFLLAALLPAQVAQQIVTIQASSTSTPAISVVQTTGPCQQVATCGGTGFNTTTGNLLAIYVIDNSAGGPTSYGDTAGDTFTALTLCTAATNDVGRIYYAKNITGHTNNTITQTGGNAVTIWVYEISGLNTSSPVDVDQSPCHTGSSSAPASSAFTTANAAEFALVGWRGNASATTSTQGSGYTQLAQDGLKLGAVQSQIFSAIQTGVTAGFSLSQSSSWGVSVATFKQ